MKQFLFDVEYENVKDGRIQWSLLDSEIDTFAYDNLFQDFLEQDSKVGYKYFVGTINSETQDRIEKLFRENHNKITTKCYYLNQLKDLIQVLINTNEEILGEQGITDDDDDTAQIGLDKEIKIRLEQNSELIKMLHGLEYIVKFLFRKHTLEELVVYEQTRIVFYWV